MEQVQWNVLSLIGSIKNHVKLKLVDLSAGSMYMFDICGVCVCAYYIVFMCVHVCSCGLSPVRVCACVRACLCVITCCKSQ